MIFSNEFTGANILVVDSDARDRSQFINLIKSNAHYNSLISEASSQVEALSLISQGAFTHVFIGCNVALNSTASLAAMKMELNNEAILIMLAAPLNERFAAHSLENGFHDYLLKDETLTLNSLLRITARAKQILKLETELKAVSNALNSRNEFLSIAAHEFKTPLTAAKLKFQVGVKVLEKFTQQNDKHIEDAQKFLNLFKDGDQQINKLHKLVDNLLDLSRLETDQLNLHLSEMNLIELINDVLERFSHQLKFAKCEAKVEMPEAIFGKWDRERLEQVISNLLTNIIRYAPNKPFGVKVSRDAEFVIIEVEDQGVGIPTIFHKKVFERYERVDKDGKNGLGLGLYIAHAIVIAHGGSIHVENASRGGALFVVKLPINSTKTP